MKNILLVLLGFIGMGQATEKPNEVDEPIFIGVSSEGAEMNKAYVDASQTVSKFVALVKNPSETTTYMAKLRFKDPDLSDKLGKDQFLYIWLNQVVYHPEENILSGVFFEVPEELRKWHQVGQRLGFESGDIFDWMVNDKGHVTGAFTIRVTRNRLKTESEKLEYDKYIGITSYEAIE